MKKYVKLYEEYTQPTKGKPVEIRVNTNNWNNIIIFGNVFYSSEYTYIGYDKEDNSFYHLEFINNSRFDTKANANAYICEIDKRERLIYYGIISTQSFETYAKLFNEPENDTTHSYIFPYEIMKSVIINLVSTDDDTLLINICLKLIDFYKDNPTRTSYLSDTFEYTRYIKEQDGRSALTLSMMRPRQIDTYLHFLQYIKTKDNNLFNLLIEDGIKVTNGEIFQWVSDTNIDLGLSDDVKTIASTALKGNHKLK